MKKEFCKLNGFVSKLPDGPALYSLEDGCLITKQIIISSNLFKIHLAFRLDKSLEVDVYILKGWFTKNEYNVGSWKFNP